MDFSEGEEWDFPFILEYLCGASKSTAFFALSFFLLEIYRLPILLESSSRFSFLLLGALPFSLVHFLILSFLFPLVPFIRLYSRIIIAS